MGRRSEHTEEEMKDAVEMLNERSGKEVAEQFEVSVPTLYNWKRKIEGGADTEAKPKAKPKAERAGKPKNGRNGHDNVTPITVQAAPSAAPAREGGLGAQVTALETENAQLRAALAKLKDAFVNLSA